MNTRLVIRLFDYFANAAGATSSILVAVAFALTPGWSRWVAAPLCLAAAMRLSLRSELPPRKDK